MVREEILFSPRKKAERSSEIKHSLIYRLSWHINETRINTSTRSDIWDKHLLRPSCYVLDKAIAMSH